MSPVAEVTALQDVRSDRDRVLDLALELARVASLSAAIELSLPALARASGSSVALFAVAGSAAAGIRGWPRDADWGHAFGPELTTVWENGPLTTLVRSGGVLPPFRLVTLMQEMGWAALPLTLPACGPPLRHAAMVVVSADGPSISGYLVARSDREYDDAELDLLSRLQAVLVASHGRFLGAGEPVALTPRQDEILRLMQEGLTAGAIASRLRISESTVGKHLRDLYARLDTHDRVSTVRAAQLRGLLDGVSGEAWQDVRMP
jgi:DNA-binding CsgD family transcriptional regulator